MKKSEKYEESQQKIEVEMLPMNLSLSQSKHSKTPIKWVFGKRNLIKWMRIELEKGIILLSIYSYTDSIQICVNPSSS